ncbi:MAG: helical backbone metal receptor [Actinomycetota bacterium]|nr:helical backbone metal receptor [Actinomycetota bacterium]
MHRSIRRLQLAVAIVVAAACTQEASPPAPSPPVREEAFPVTVEDDEGVEVTLDAEPRRLVTFAPSNTEIVFALGLGDRLVGVAGEFDDHPPQARDIERVGGAGEFGVDPNVERVVELEPDLMLAAFPGGEWKDRLRELGIPVFTILAEDLDDALADIETVGALTGAGEEAEALTATMRAEAEEATAGIDQRVTCFFEVGFEGGFFTVGPGSFIYDLLERAGCDPVTAEATDPFPQWSVEALVEADPDAYLVSSESGGTPQEVAERPGFEALSAVRDGRVVLIDSDLVSRPGPRVVEGLRELVAALHAPVD